MKGQNREFQRRYVTGKSMVVLAAIMALTLMMILSACGKDSSSKDGSTGGISTADGSENPSGKAAANAPAEDVFRIVDGAEDGNLLLAKLGGSGIYRLSVDDDAKIEITVDGEEADASALVDGMEVSVSFDGNILETYPARFSGVTALSAETPPGGGYTDLCGFYLKVLDDLWNTDSGLNEGISVAGLDLSNAPGDLEESEIQAVAWRFGELHSVSVVTGTFEELAEQGYIDEKNLCWEDGCLFSIAKHEVSGIESYSLPVLRFDAEKWCSGTGAYFFNDCTAVWPEFGSWTGYTKGGEAIS